MYQNFTNNCFGITISKTSDIFLRVGISSDYVGSNRKSRIYVNEKHLAEDVERTWKQIKTKKILLLNASFGEIDWYDDMTDTYTTPVIKIERGLRKAKVREQEHGSIPKEWSFDVVAKFDPTISRSAVIDAIKIISGRYFTPKAQKAVLKGLADIRANKTTYFSYEESGE